MRGPEVVRSWVPPCGGQKEEEGGEGDVRLGGRVLLYVPYQGKLFNGLFDLI